MLCIVVFSIVCISRCHGHSHIRFCMLPVLDCDLVHFWIVVSKRT